MSQSSGPNSALTEAICKNKDFLSTRNYRLILLHLDLHHDDPNQRKAAAIIRVLRGRSGGSGKEFESTAQDPNTYIRTTICRLRQVLRTHFIYVDPDAPLQLDIPEADESGVYQLRAEKHLYDIFGPERFWFPHFRNQADNLIVFTEPVFFRIFAKNERLFIRDLDLNETDPATSNETLIATFKKRLQKTIPRLKGIKVTVSRGFIPGGEVFAKDLLKAWFQEHSRDLVQQKVTKKPIHCDEIVSGDADWFERTGAHRRSLMDYNLVLLGSARTNPKVRRLQKDSYSRFRYRIEDRGLTVAMPQKGEVDRLRSRGIVIKDLRGPRIILSEDWSKESLVLVTRGPHLHPLKVTTAIVANQGRGIHAISRLPTDHEKWMFVTNTLGLPSWLPSEFQMIFHVDLDHQEARFGECTPLLYSSDSNSQNE